MDRAALEDALANADRAAQAGDPQAAEDARQLADALYNMGAAQEQPPKVDTSGAPIGLRFRLGDANTPAERQNALNQRYPLGEMRELPVYGSVYRESPDDQWRQVNPKGLDWGDPAEFMSGDTGAMVGGIAAAALTKNPSLLRLSLMGGGGALTGDLAQQGVQEARGVNEESFGEMLPRAAAKGALDAAGNFVLSPVVGALNIARGAGATKVPAEGRAAMNAASELGMPQLPIGAITDVPWLRTIEAQSSRLHPILRRQYAETAQSLVNITNNLGADPGDLVRMLDDASRSFNDTLMAANRRGVTMSQGGQALQEGVKAYSITSRNAVKSLYDKANAIAPAKFDTASLREAAQTILDGVPVPVRAAKEGAEEGAEQTVMRNVSPVDRELADVAETIGAMDLDAAPDPLGALQELRSRLFDLATPDAGQPFRKSHRKAKQLYDSLTDTMNNPVNPDPAFQDAYKAASKAAAQRFTNLERAAIVQAAKTETPAQLAARLRGSYQIDNLETLRQILPEPKFKQFKDAVFDDFLAAGPDLPNMLKGLDEPTRRALFDDAAYEALDQAGRIMHSMHRFGVGDILERQVDNAAVVRELVSSKDTRRIFNLQRLALENPELKDSIRAGIMDDFVSQVINIKDGARFVDEGAVKRYLDSLTESGMRRFLTPDDLRVIRNIDAVAPFARRASDVGASIQAAELSAQMLKGNPKAYVSMLHYMGVGRFLSSDFGRRVLIGAPGGAQWTQAKMARALTGALTASIGTTSIEDALAEGNTGNMNGN